jgi:hypothetical protein
MALERSLLTSGYAEGDGSEQGQHLSSQQTRFQLLINGLSGNWLFAPG